MLRVLALVACLSIPTFSSTGSAKTNLKLRSQPNTSSESIGSVSVGSSFEVLDQQGDFYHVNSNGQEGYLAAKYVSIEKPSKWDQNTPIEKAKAIALMIYSVIGLIMGEIMIRGYMMRFFNGLTFFSTTGPINFFIDLIFKRIGWEVFVAALSIPIGCVLGPFFIVYRVIKAKQEQSFEVAQ